MPVWVPVWVLIWVLIWDNASGQVSRALRAWIRTHNPQVKRHGQGVRILACSLPVTSPWLTPIEPLGVHRKRASVEPTRLLTAHAVAERVCASLDCAHARHASRTRSRHGQLIRH